MNTCEWQMHTGWIWAQVAGHWTVYREAFTDPEALHGILKGPVTILASHLFSL